jgi:hypothetical protein
MGASSADSARIEKVKVVPTPGLLSTLIDPPINSQIRFEIARPKPVPPYLRVVESSTWEKG